MLAAIDFYNQSLFTTYKIDDVRTDRLLPDEFSIGYLPVSQPPPQLLLGISLIRT